MRRIVQVGPRGLLLTGVAVALAVLVASGSGARSASAQPTVPHYECFDFVGAAPGVSVDLETQFGVESGVVVGPGHYLCPPALKNGEGDLEQPHLRCYDIDEPAPGRTVDLLTQFGLEEDVVVDRAKELCVPAVKGPPLSDPPLVPHYKCYEIAGFDPDVQVELQTQFGTVASVDVGQAVRVCLAALKNGEGDLGAQDLECYDITGGADPAVSHEVRTQFGDEGPTAVGLSQRLCVPALKVKVVSLGVGGIAELPPLAGTSAEEAGAPTDGSGWSSGAYAALAGGLAAAAVALGGGAWYARRRWIQ